MPEDYCSSFARSPLLMKRRSVLWIPFLTLAEVLTTAGARAQGGGAGFQIVVHPEMNRNNLERGFVADALLKKQTRWDNGTLIHPVDLVVQSAVRESFSQTVLKRSVASVRSYWQQRIFSGRGVPPPELSSDEAVVRYVAGQQGGIGYVSPRANLKGVRVVTIED